MERLTRGSEAIAAALVVAGVVWSASAGAQGAKSDPATAEVLFRDGKELMAKGDYEAACPKLAESQRLDPGTGTLMALAYCHERQGRIASAWAEYTSVLGAAQQAGQAERVRVATQHIAALEPRLPKMRVAVAASGASRRGLEVRRDGVVLGEAAWGTTVPVDPGEHEVTAQAAGFKTWSARVDVRSGAPVDVVVPELEAEAPAPATASASAGITAIGGSVERKDAPAALGEHGGRTAGFVIAGVGLVALGIGSYFGVRTFEKRDEANGLCPEHQPCTDPNAVTANDAAHTSALVSTIAVGAGLVALGGGIYLVLTSKPGTKAANATGVAPLVGREAVGMTWSSRW